MLHRSEIRIRDPFILTDFENKCYYMYGTTALEKSSIAAKDSFSVYKSYDLEYFSLPKTVFEGSKINFWATKDYWAPEVHKYNGKYYLFGSCKSETRHRATQIFVSDTPDGIFTPLSDAPATPADWECLDGTLWIEDDTPYLVFCHEWTQIKDGEMCAVRLSEDLSAPIGEPFVLFRASDAVGVTEIQPNSGNYITDGPFLYSENGKTKMLWSSLFNGKYAVLTAESDSLRGTWSHLGSRFAFDGGHAMVFERLDGKKMITLHAPNQADKERAFFAEF